MKSTALGSRLSTTRKNFSKRAFIVMPPVLWKLQAGLPILGLSCEDLQGQHRTSSSAQGWNQGVHHRQKASDLQALLSPFFICEDIISKARTSGNLTWKKWASSKQWCWWPSRSSSRKEGLTKCSWAKEARWSKGCEVAFSWFHHIQSLGFWKLQIGRITIKLKTSKPATTQCIIRISDLNYHDNMGFRKETFANVASRDGIVAVHFMSDFFWASLQVDYELLRHLSPLFHLDEFIISKSSSFGN